MLQQQQHRLLPPFWSLQMNFVTFHGLLLKDGIFHVIAGLEPNSADFLKRFRNKKRQTND